MDRIPLEYENMELFFMRMESLGEVMKFYQLIYGWAKVSEGGVNLILKVIVLQIELSLTWLSMLRVTEEEKKQAEGAPEQLKAD